MTEEEINAAVDEAATEIEATLAEVDPTEAAAVVEEAVVEETAEIEAEAITEPVVEASAAEAAGIEVVTTSEVAKAGTEAVTQVAPVAEPILEATVEPIAVVVEEVPEVGMVTQVVSEPVTVESPPPVEEENAIDSTLATAEEIAALAAATGDAAMATTVDKAIAEIEAL